MATGEWQDNIPVGRVPLPAQPPSNVGPQGQKLVSYAKNLLTPKVKEATTSKYLGQYKERQGAQKEVGVRIGDAESAWPLLKSKIPRCKRLSKELRIRLYTCLVTSRLMGAAETILLRKAELQRMEGI